MFAYVVQGHHFMRSMSFVTSCRIAYSIERTKCAKNLILLTAVYLNKMSTTFLRYACSSVAIGWTVRDRIPVGRDFPPVQTGPGAHPTSLYNVYRSFPGGKCGRGVLLITHPLLVPRSWKSRAIPLPTLWATPGWDHFYLKFYETLDLKRMKSLNNRELE